MEKSLSPGKGQAGTSSALRMVNGFAKPRGGILITIPISPGQETFVKFGLVGEPTHANPMGQVLGVVEGAGGGIGGGLGPRRHLQQP